MRLVLLCVLAGMVIAARPKPKYVVAESLRFSAFETRTMVVSGMLTGEDSTQQLRIRGIVSRPAQELKIEEQRHANLDALTASVREAYCTRAYLPAGESVFNAGRNISAVLGDYVPAELRIEVSYHAVYFRGNKSATRTTSFVCANSMRD